MITNPSSGKKVLLKSVIGAKLMQQHENKSIKLSTLDKKIIRRLKKMKGGGGEEPKCPLTLETRAQIEGDQRTIYRDDSWDKKHFYDSCALFQWLLYNERKVFVKSVFGRWPHNQVAITSEEVEKLKEFKFFQICPQVFKQLKCPLTNKTIEAIENQGGTIFRDHEWPMGLIYDSCALKNYLRENKYFPNEIPYSYKVKLSFDPSDLLKLVLKECPDRTLWHLAQAQAVYGEFKTLITRRENDMSKHYSEYLDFAKRIYKDLGLMRSLRAYLQVVLNDEQERKGILKNMWRFCTGSEAVEVCTMREFAKVKFLVYNADTRMPTQNTGMQVPMLLPKGSFYFAYDNNNFKRLKGDINEIDKMLFDESNYISFLYCIDCDLRSRFSLTSKIYEIEKPEYLTSILSKYLKGGKSQKQHKYEPSTRKVSTKINGLVRKRKIWVNTVNHKDYVRYKDKSGIFRYKRVI